MWLSGWTLTASLMFLSSQAVAIVFLPHQIVHLTKEATKISIDRSLHAFDQSINHRHIERLS